jgi:GTP:adenosylcobinamide-phosphate guanylyltransferase
VSKPHVTAIIPARGGSKGIHRKNLALIDGRPLIEYSIRSARQAVLIDTVVVSTDDEEIRDVAAALGALVPGLRPKPLANDTALIGSAIDYTLGRLIDIGIVTDLVVSLYPTSPFRPPGMIDFLVSRLLEGCSPAFTAKNETPSQEFCIIDSAGRIQPLPAGTPSDLTGNSVSYKSTTGLFVGYNCRTVSSNTPYIHTIDNPIANIDIDTYDDLSLANMVAKSCRINEVWFS